MYTQLFKEILTNTEHDEDAHLQYAKNCPLEDKMTSTTTKIFEEFQSQFKEYTAIRSYTKESFLHRKLNEASRQLKGDTLNNLVFFVRQLHQQLKNTEENLVLYRDQGLSKADFEKLKKSKDQLYAFNVFLETIANSLRKF